MRILNLEIPLGTIKYRTLYRLLGAQGLTIAIIDEMALRPAINSL